MSIMTSRDYRKACSNNPYNLDFLLENSKLKCNSLIIGASPLLGQAIETRLQ